MGWTKSRLAEGKKKHSWKHVQHLLSNLSAPLNFINKREFLSTECIKVWANWKWKISSLNHCQRSAVLSIGGCSVVVFNTTVGLHPVAMGRLPGLHIVVSPYVLELVYAWTELVGSYHLANSSEAISCVMAGSVVDVCCFFQYQFHAFLCFLKSVLNFSTSFSELWLNARVSCVYRKPIIYPIVLVTLIGWELAHDPGQINWDQQDSVPGSLFDL